MRYYITSQETGLANVMHETNSYKDALNYIKQYIQGRTIYHPSNIPFDDYYEVVKLNDCEMDDEKELVFLLEVE